MFMQYLEVPGDLYFSYCTERCAFIASPLHLCFPAHRLIFRLGWGSWLLRDCSLHIQ